MLLWVHSAFRTFGVSCKSAPPSTVAQLNGLCLLHAPQHLANGYRAMQFHPDGGGAHLCSGPVDAQRLPGLRRLLRKLSAIGCRVLDRICTRLYLIQIARRSANGYLAMQLRILAR